MPSFAASELKRPVAQFTSPVDAVVRRGLTMAQAMQSLRERPLGAKIFYIYVVDESEKLVGVVPTRSFILAEPGQLIDELMISSVISVTSSATMEEVLEVFAMYRLLALPVVDDEGRLLGAVDVQLYAEEMVDIAQSSHTGGSSDKPASPSHAQVPQDIFQLIGMSAEAAKHRTAWSGFKLRMPWLAFNLVGGLACALISWLFEATLERVLLLTMFVPLVLTLSESVAMQSMTLGIQLLHGSTVPWIRIRRRLAAEWRTAGVLGTACGLVVGGAALLWREGLHAPGIIAVSIALSMTLAASIGVILPAVLHAFRLDPKLAAGPLVLMVGDILTMALYLGLATLWLT